MRALLIACVIAIAVGGCNAIAGIEPATLRQGVCDRPQSGAARVRIGDLVPTIDRHDVCLRRTDGASPLDGVALPQSGGGIGYEQVLAPITLPAGAYDVTLQATGSSCAGAPIASASVCISPGTTSLYAFGDGLTTTEIVALPESTAATNGTRLRFVHAIAGEPALDFGRASGALPDATIAPIFGGVSTT
jgi:hypothetical protein